MTAGRIVNIQHFCIHDGPGIRTTVFFKGCPLRCLWCSNPDMQKFDQELAYAKSRCIGCCCCIQVCAEHCLSLTEEGIAIDRQRCSLCGKCAQACPAQAIHLQGLKMTVDQIVDEVSDDRVFYQNSGGGVTLSGGEALAQKDFALALLQACKAVGLHTALETSACVPYEHLRETVAYVDHLFIDVKHLSDEKHRVVTGTGNARILQHILKIQEEHQNVHIRIPVIPTINDTEAELEAMARFLEPLSGIRDVELLQYHDLGLTKYAQIGRPYPLQNVPNYDLARLEALVAFFRTKCPSRKVFCQAS